VREGPTRKPGASGVPPLALSMSSKCCKDNRQPGSALWSLTAACAGVVKLAEVDTAVSDDACARKQNYLTTVTLLDASSAQHCKLDVHLLCAKPTNVGGLRHAAGLSLLSRIVTCMYLGSRCSPYCFTYGLLSSTCRETGSHML
jgi:hypothetical protein